MAQTRRRAYPAPGSTTVERPEHKYGARGNARHKNVRQQKAAAPEPTKSRRNRR